MTQIDTINPRRNRSAEPSPRVHLIRPQLGTAVSAGESINGVGWIDGAEPDLQIEIMSGRKRLGQARVGIPPEELAMLIEQPLAESATGFVFSVVLPMLPAGRTTLRLQIKTETSQQNHDVKLTVVAPAIPAQIEPVRAMVESAEIDARGVLRVIGWAVSLLPLQKLQVFLGERLVGLAEHGTPRDDVAAILPAYRNALRSGFFFRAALTAPEPNERTVRVVSVTADGISRAISAPLTRHEPLQGDKAQSDAAQGFVELDIERVCLSKDGVFALSGWAVASVGVAELLVELDGTLIASEMPNENRPDVAKAFPQIPAVSRSGFRVIRRLAPPKGESALLRVVVRGRDGTEQAAQRSVTIAPRAWP